MTDAILYIGLGLAWVKLYLSGELVALVLGSCSVRFLAWSGYRDLITGLQGGEYKWLYPFSARE